MIPAQPGTWAVFLNEDEEFGCYASRVVAWEHDYDEQRLVPYTSEERSRYPERVDSIYHPDGYYWEPDTLADWCRKNQPLNMLRIRAELQARRDA